MAKPSKASKFFKTLLTVLLLLIIIITIGINVAFFKPYSAPFNSIYVMQQTDMNDVQYGDAVIASPNKVSELQPGNVVLCLTSFDNEFKEVLKLIDITQEDGTTYYYVRSDQETNDDALKLTQDKILAKCLWTNSSLGAIITFVKSTVGIGILVALPCLILLIIKISSTIEEQKEAKKEEELRKKNKKKNRKEKNKSNDDNNDDDNETKSKPKNKDNKSKSEYSNIDADEFFNKPINKPIPVKQLSKEESIKQREEISNIIGSELNNNAREITREFNTAELRVSPMNHVNAVKIEEDIPTEENVHSPNMNEKAIQIRKNLSNTLADDDIKPVIAMVKTSSEKSVENTKPVETPKVVETKPITKVEDTKLVEEPKQDINKTIENAVIIIPKTEPKKVEISQTNIKDTSFNEDDFLKDIISKSDEKSNSSSISDDFLDQILNSIPSTQKTEEFKKPIENTTKRNTKNVERRNNNRVVKHHKVTNKVVDNTSFDELIKAIEKEKNGIK